MKETDLTTQNNPKGLKNQSGQTLLEFILLLLSIVIIAFSFMRLVNSNLGDIWERTAQAILEDTSQRLRLQ